MELYRITQEQYAHDLTGNGARLFGGRWNSEGVFAVYTSFSRSLALLETLAHTPAKMLDQKTYILITLSVPGSIPADEIGVNNLDSGWDAPAIRSLTQKLGDKFLRSKAGLLLAVPSVLVPEEKNYILNPLHTDMKRVKISQQRRIHFDKRVALNV